MKKEELRTAIQEMNTFQFGQRNEIHNKLSKIKSYVAKQEVLDFVSKLDKQIDDDKTKLPVIPQFVAHWIKYTKSTGITLCGALDVGIIEHHLKINDTTELKGYLILKENQETFARAWLDGYTIEPEMKYILKNQRGFVASMIVQQSEAELKSLIKINYTENEKEARKFNKYDKDFFTEVGHLEVEEVN